MLDRYRTAKQQNDGRIRNIVEASKALLTADKDEVLSMSAVQLQEKLNIHITTEMVIFARYVILNTDAEIVESREEELLTIIERAKRVLNGTD